VAVRNGLSNASLSLETFLGPKPGRRASCAVSARAIFAKLCVPPQHQSSSFQLFSCCLIYGGGRGTHAKGRSEGLCVCLVYALDARQRCASERAWGFVYTLADEGWWAVLGLFVGGKVLACLVYAACVWGGCCARV
jgi:hypothetical protein